MFQHSEYWVATIVLGSILGGLVVFVGIVVYKQDAVLDKLEEFLRRRKTARSRDQQQELTDVTLQPQDQQQQTQPQQQHQQQTQPQQIQTWEDAEPTSPQIRLQVWPDARAQTWPNNWPETWPELRPTPQGAAEPVYANVCDEAPQDNMADEAPQANVADKAPAAMTKETIEAILSLAAAVAAASHQEAAAGRQEAATDVAKHEAQANDADEAPQDYAFDGENTQKSLNSLFLLITYSTSVFNENSYQAL